MLHKKTFERWFLMTRGLKTLKGGNLEKHSTSKEYINKSRISLYKSCLGDETFDLTRSSLHFR